MMKLIERETFHICGYAVETTASQNDKDVSGLYTDFFDMDRESALLSLYDSKKGYYGLSWYTQGHEKYCYLLGIEVGEENIPPENSLLKEVAKTTYAVGCYLHGKDVIEAWNEFFYTDIPNEGYAPNEQFNLYFEYYPKDVKGDFELWVPVVKTNV
jgi:predicted transcriptional regulator YdeE